MVKQRPATCNLQPATCDLRPADQTRRILVTISRDLPDKSEFALSKFLEWTNPNDTHFKASKCKELILPKGGSSNGYPLLHNIKQYSSISILGLTIQDNCKFSLYIWEKLNEAYL